MWFLKTGSEQALLKSDTKQGKLEEVIVLDIMCTSTGKGKK